MPDKNTDHIDYKALYEQIAHEYEEYRVKTAKIKLGSITPEMIQYAVKKALSNPYFWIGYAIAMIFMLIIGLFERKRY